jgi:parallel beta-helix repeat protein
MLARMRVLLAFGALLVAASHAHADYWVSNSGNNGNDGLTPGTAWSTLVFASGQVGPGDTVHVQPGNYQGFYLDTSGTAGNPITFLAEGTVNITSDNPNTPDGINVEGADYVVIDGFTVNDATRAGIRAALSDFVTVRNNSCGNNGRWGIFTGFTDDFTVENNETYGSVLEHGIYVSNSSDRPTIRNNVIHDNHANGIHLNGDLSQGGHGLIHDALIENNVIYGNGVGGGSGINGDGLTSSVIRNNLLYDNHASGISLYQIDAADGAKNNLVVNNTIINASNARWCVNISDGSTGNTVVNNILYNFHGFRGVITIDAASLPGFASDYNSLMDRFSIDGGDTVIDFNDWQAEGYDANSFLATPTDHFVAPGSNFHLKGTSPAIDAGTSTDAPTSDLEGNPRPVGTGFDMGAYELQLLECGDGNTDPGEQCGEPSLTCSDPCTSCSQCICAVVEVCGDLQVCGSEQCEDDGDCGVGQTCSGCQCENAPPCTSGIAIAKPRIVARTSKPRLLIKGRATVPVPWVMVDPPANGVSFVIDHESAPQQILVTIPGGAGWTTNSSNTRWTYRDPNGANDGITKVTVGYDATQDPGLVKLSAKGTGPQPLTIPPDDAVRLHALVGGPGECASVVFSGPGGPRPNCDGDSSSLTCH